MTDTLNYAVKQFLVEGKTEIRPHLINAFLRIMETMERTCTASLRYSEGKAFYQITPGI
jgi:hypothetical protein